MKHESNLKSPIPAGQSRHTVQRSYLHTLSSAGGVIATGSPTALKAINSLNSVLAAWRRRQNSGWEALDAYRRETHLEVFVENEEQYRASA